MSTHEKIVADFIKKCIPTDSPDFYDHPNFVAAEQKDPKYLNNYAFYVASRPYSAEYLDNARTKISNISKILCAQLKENGRQGACVDITGILARILEKEGIWCACIKGSCTINFPSESGEETNYFYSVDSGNFVAGHAWLYAPPFDVVDLTIHHQAYSGNKKAYIPEFVIAESARNGKYCAQDVVSPEVALHMRMSGIRPSDILKVSAGGIDVVQKHFPTKEVDGIRGAQIKYVPVAIHASIEKLEGMGNMSFNGKKPHEMYEHHIVGKFA